MIVYAENLKKGAVCYQVYHMNLNENVGVVFGTCFHSSKLPLYLLLHVQ